MIVRTIQFNSDEYKRMIELRIKALLEPIGVPAHYINPLKEKDDVFIGAFEDGEIIGCCILTPKGKDTVQLRQMAVLPQFQGRHIGAAIIQFAEQTAKQLGFHTLMMHARNPVIDFYKKCGYQIAGEEFFEVGIGHHKMQKVLI
jgi:N-acetylglutamate synthase-like GNAT family acetyltransferase